MNLVRAVRRSAGLSVVACAAGAGIPHARLSEYEHGRHQPSVARLQALARAAGLRFVPVPVPSTVVTAAEAADEVYEVLRSGAIRAESRALRVVFQLHDDLAAAPSHVLPALVATPAPPTGDARFDALVAGVVEWHTRGRGLPVPPWVSEPERTVEPPWQPDPHTERSDAIDVLVRHGVILAASELESV